jgi:regulator of RNase E activity RraA
VFEPGGWCYADADGIVVAPGPVHRAETPG